MAAPVYAAIASGFAVSSAFVLAPADRAWAVFVPSMTGAAVRLEFTTLSGGAGEASFGALFSAPDQDSLVVSSSVRPCWGLVFTPVSPFARLRTSSALSDTASFALFPLNR